MKLETVALGFASMIILATVAGISYNVGYKNGFNDSPPPKVIVDNHWYIIAPCDKTEWHDAGTKKGDLQVNVCQWYDRTGRLVGAGVVTGTVTILDGTKTFVCAGGPCAGEGHVTAWGLVAGSMVSLTASPTASFGQNWVFAYWEINGKILSTESAIQLWNLGDGFTPLTINAYFEYAPLN